MSRPPRSRAPKSTRCSACCAGLKRTGVTMIYITHRLPEVLAICDRATVLRDGPSRARWRATNSTRSGSSSPCPGAAAAGAVSGAIGAAAIRPADGAPAHRRGLVDAATLRPQRALHDVSFSVQPGEIVGLAGLLGSGRSEILHAHLRPLPNGGQLSRRRTGRPIRSPPTRARRHRAPDRRSQARRPALQSAGRREHHHRQSRGRQPARHGQRRPRAQRDARAHARAERQGAVARRRSVAHLSGGNQQKLLFARVLMRGSHGPAAGRADQGRRCGDAAGDLSAGRRARRQGRRPDRRRPPSSRR